MGRCSHSKCCSPEKQPCHSRQFLAASLAFASSNFLRQDLIPPSARVGALCPAAGVEPPPDEYIAMGRKCFTSKQFPAVTLAVFGTLTCLSSQSEAGTLPACSQRQFPEAARAHSGSMHTSAAVHWSGAQLHFLKSWTTLKTCTSSGLCMSSRLWGLASFSICNFSAQESWLVFLACSHTACHLSHQSGHCRTSIASYRSQRALPDRCQTGCQIGCQNRCQTERLNRMSDTRRPE